MIVQTRLFSCGLRISHMEQRPIKKCGNTILSVSDRPMLIRFPQTPELRRRARRHGAFAEACGVRWAADPIGGRTVDLSQSSGRSSFGQQSPCASPCQCAASNSSVACACLHPFLRAISCTARSPTCTVFRIFQMIPTWRSQQGGAPLRGTAGALVGSIWAAGDPFSLSRSGGQRLR
jgi:hypothetical protein